MSNDRRTTGLYNKFRVERTDGKSEPGQKHHGCEYFVLDVTHDPFAISALAAYARSCASEYPELAKDLRKIVKDARDLKVIGKALRRFEVNHDDR